MNFQEDLVSLRHDAALAWSTSPQIVAQVLFGELDSGRTAVDNHHIARPMRFARRGDAESLPKTVASHALNYSGLRRLCEGNRIASGKPAAQQHLFTPSSRVPL